MPKRYSAKQVIKALKRLNFVKVSQKGSHVKMRGIREGKIQTVIIPDHKQLAVGTFSSILKQANVSKQELEDQL